MRTTVILLLILFSSAGTLMRNSVYKDDLSLWADTALKSKSKPRPRAVLGYELLMRGEVDAAIPELEAAVALYQNNPDNPLSSGYVDKFYVEALNNLGSAYRKQGRMDGALAYYRKAIQLRPYIAGFHYNLADALRETGQLDEAISEYQTAVRLQPNYADALNNLGLSYALEGRLREAADAFSTAVTLDPENARYRRNLEKAQYFLGQSQSRSSRK